MESLPYGGCPKGCFLYGKMHRWIVGFGRTESSAPADGPEVREEENKKHRSHEKISGEAVFYVDKAGASMVQ